MRAAVRYGDGWNGWCPTDPDDGSVIHLLDLLEQACVAADRDPSTIHRTGDLTIDPLDLRGARQRSVETLQRLDELGFDEVRCYTICDETRSARLEALEAYAEMLADI
jgi:alkanesulfonate monooxygenase SsuD/methylene tetrahydromethanopterin reductase-like flavin-dependent oxidoreductase (luciferase family)